MVGFDVFGGTGSKSMPSAPGQVYEFPEGANYASGGTVPAAALRGKPPLNEKSKYAKWALGGRIVLIPPMEQHRSQVKPPPPPSSHHRRH